MNIKEYLKEKLIDCISDTYIVEMAINRSKYQDKLSLYKRQIIENWCLMRYCTLTNSKLELRAHWGTELKSYLNDLFYIDLKDDKSRYVKYKATRQQYIEYDELDVNVDYIYNLIKDKFRKEGLSDKTIIYQAASDFTEHISTICDLISVKPTGDNYKKLENYIFNEI